MHRALCMFLECIQKEVALKPYAPKKAQTHPQPYEKILGGKNYKRGVEYPTWFRGPVSYVSTDPRTSQVKFAV